MNWRKRRNHFGDSEYEEEIFRHVLEGEGGPSQGEGRGGDAHVPAMWMNVGELVLMEAAFCRGVGVRAWRDEMWVVVRRWWREEHAAGREERWW